MPLSLLDCVAGTIVDHTWLVADRTRTLRPIRRCGIIMRAEGEGTDSVPAVWVKFNEKDDAERILPVELDRVEPASHPKARRSYRRMTGKIVGVGSEVEQHPAPVRPKLVDALRLRSHPKGAVVAPEGGWDKDDEPSEDDI